ncbi:MAG: peptidoglycan editing factor PgeF [Sphingomonadaceae bacterium]
MTGTINAIRSHMIEPFPHAFLGRTGGISAGLYHSLNVGLGSGDDRRAVEHNRAQVETAVLPGASLVTAYQIHSADVITVTGPFSGERPQADALVTDRPGLLLGILTADCVPVLFADSAAGIVGVAHAGWKGALGGVTDATIAAMEALGAARDHIVAAIGPCIGRASYEVGDDFAQRFEQADRDNERFFTAGRTGHQFFDIEAYVTNRLATAGVTRIDAKGIDTVTRPDHYFSYRRATLAGESDYGRQISVIGISA